MRIRRNVIRATIGVLLVMVMTTMPICAMEQDNTTYSVQPRYNHVGSVALTIGFDLNNTVYCGLSVAPYEQCTGVSGIMKLFDSKGTCLAVWSVSDYVRPIMVENTYQGVYGETYTCTFFGYAYSNNQTPPDELDMSVTDTCVDAD